MMSLSYSEWARHGKWLLAKFNIPQACWDTLLSTVRDSSRFCLFMESMVASWLRPQLGCSWNLPCYQLTRTAGPQLAAGNTVLL